MAGLPPSDHPGSHRDQQRCHHPNRDSWPGRHGSQDGHQRQQAGFGASNGHCATGGDLKSGAGRKPATPHSAKGGSEQVEQLGQHEQAPAEPAGVDRLVQTYDGAEAPDERGERDRRPGYEQPSRGPRPGSEPRRSHSGTGSARAATMGSSVLPGRTRTDPRAATGTENARAEPTLSRSPGPPSWPAPAPAIGTASPPKNRGRTSRGQGRRHRVALAPVADAQGMPQRDDGEPDRDRPEAEGHTFSGAPEATTCPPVPTNHIAVRPRGRRPGRRRLGPESQESSPSTASTAHDETAATRPPATSCHRGAAEPSSSVRGRGILTRSSRLMVPSDPSAAKSPGARELTDAPTCTAVSRSSSP